MSETSVQLPAELLTSIDSIRVRTKALAMLDAIVCPEWDGRYYSFNASWGDNEEMASMRNGCGDEWFILFGPFGAAIKGLDHESKFVGNAEFIQEIRKQLPVSFSPFYNEPAFEMDWVSYCFWRENNSSTWKKVVHPDPAYHEVCDGSSEYLAPLHESAESYREFAGWYYEIELPLDLIQKIYSLEPITEAMAKLINPTLEFQETIIFAEEIGYPVEKLKKA